MPNGDDLLKKLQLKMLRIQQGVYHNKQRVIIAFEGTDAAGKGGAIRRLTLDLDPRGFKVHPIGAPSAKAQGKHYLYRFWKKLPAPGTIAVFDRTWYGRVLVERVEGFTPKERWKMAYEEINQFEKLLADDGVIIIKVFLKISRKEQLKRFEARLKDPYKQWKITKDDIRNREKWNEYEKAYAEMIEKTNTKYAPWCVIETDDKDVAREKVLKLVTERCRHIEKWMEEKASQVLETKQIKEALESLK